MFLLFHLLPCFREVCLLMFMCVRACALGMFPILLRVAVFKDGQFTVALVIEVHS